MIWVLFMFWKGMEKERMGREDVVEDEDESKSGIRQKEQSSTVPDVTQTIR